MRAHIPAALTLVLSLLCSGPTLASGSKTSAPESLSPARALANHLSRAVSGIRQVLQAPLFEESRARRRCRGPDAIQSVTSSHGCDPSLVLSHKYVAPATSRVMGRPKAIQAPPRPGPRTVGVSWAEQERLVLDQVNRLRVQGTTCGARGWFPPSLPLARELRLTRSARAYARSLAESGHFSHVSPEGQGVPDRIEEAGYENWSAVGENLAAGQMGAAEVVSAWRESDDHCANLMNPRYTDVGIGLYATGEGYDWHWVQHFGAEHPRR